MMSAKLARTSRGMDTKPQTKCVLLVCFFLVLTVLAVYGQTARFGFVNCDDGVNVSENPAVEKGLSFRAAGWAFTHAQACNWIPLPTLSHMLDCQVFGLDAGGHHMVNVLWHAGNAVLLFLVLGQMTGSFWSSAFVAAVFAVHPLRVESVAWVSERKDVLSGFFFLLTIGIYVRYVRQPSRAGYGLMALTLALGLLAKSMVATLPFVLLLLDYWPLGRLQNKGQFRRLFVEKVPLFILSAAGCAATALAPGLLVNARQISFLERLGNAAVSYVVYLRQTFFPTGLACLYPYLPNSQPLWKVGVRGPGRYFRRGGGLPKKVPVFIDRLALVLGYVIAGDRAGSNLVRRGPRRPLHLSAGNRIGDCRDLGGGPLVGPLALPRHGRGRTFRSWAHGPGYLRSHPDFLLA